MNKGILFPLMAAFLPGSLQADANSYTYIGAELTGVDLGFMDLFGVGLKGSYALHPRIFARAAVSDLRGKIGINEVKYRDWSYGLGLVFFSSSTSSAYAGAEKLSAKLKAGPFNEKGEGHAFFSGYRTDLYDRLELNAELYYADIYDDTQTSLSVGVLYTTLDNNNLGFSSGLSYAEGDLGWALGVRLSF